MIYLVKVSVLRGLGLRVDQFRYMWFLCLEGLSKMTPERYAKLIASLQYSKCTKKGLWKGGVWGGGGVDY